MNNLSKQYIKELVDCESPIILDIGCYDGKDSREMAVMFKWPTIHCFDVDERSQKLFLELNKGHKRFERQLILWKMALSNINGIIDFYPSDSKTRRHYDFQDSWSASGSIRKPKYHLELFPEVTFTEAIKVSSMKLDNWHKKMRVDIVDFIWADVNGAEEDLIRGGIDTIKNYTKFLYIETSDKECYEGEIKRDEILKLLPDFEILGIYNDEGNFGNVLLKNKTL